MVDQEAVKNLMGKTRHHKGINELWNFTSRSQLFCEFNSDNKQYASKVLFKDAYSNGPMT